MITSIHLKNFQAHKDSRLDLSPGVNVITGPSDQGKSSILRALGWAVFNNLRGEGYRREGAAKNEPVSVTVTTPEGTVVRARKGTTNTYHVGGEQLSAVGSGVPDMVGELLRISPHAFQRQGDGPFMLAEPAGFVAQAINKLAGFDIDDVFSGLAAATNSARAKAAHYRELVVSAQDVIDKSPDVADLERRLVGVERLAARVATLRSEVQSLDRCVSRVVGSERKLNSANAVLEALGPVERLCTLRARYKNQLAECQPLERAVNSVLAASTRVDQRQQVLDGLQRQIKELRATIKVCPTCKRPMEVQG